MNAFGMPREPARQPPLSGAPPVDPWTAAQQNPMLEAGLQYGQQVLQDKSQGLVSYITVVTGFRRYFRVDNQYVKRKLLMLLFPFLYRMPKGEVGGISSSASSGGGDYEEKGYPTGFGADAPVTTPTSGWQQDADNTPLPTEDVYAFDLYLPLMGATTYIILSSFIYGLHHNSVSNEQLLGPAWSLLFWLQVEVIILKVGCYLLRIVPASTILDLVALCSYKYITVCLAALLKEVFQLEGETIYNCAVLIYAALTTGFFTAMMLQRAHQRDQRAQYKVKLFAYSAALLQVPMVTWLSVRPFR
uniref:Protein YIF1 n=1 Tax=Trypanosoma congolense (strain IL3000) TaxID=1068625 RepID=G0UIZ6_TRYCI|nr:conserved hypothetical protein [Trypanosoma congolense IL3000]